MATTPELSLAEWHQLAPLIDQSPTTTLVLPLFFVALSVLSLVWSLYVRPAWEARKPFANVPMLPHRHWFFGHGFHLVQKGSDYISHQHSLYRQHANDSGRTGLYILQNKAMILTDARDVRYVLRHETHKSAPTLAFHHLSRLLGTEQLGFLNGPKWKAHRAAILRGLANPAALGRLRRDVLRVTQTVTRTLQDRIIRQQQQIDDYYEFEICKLMILISIDSLGLSALSFPFDGCQTLELHEFTKSFAFVMGDVFRRIEDQPFCLDNIFYGLPTARNRAFHQHVHKIRSLMRRIVQEHQTSKCGSEEPASDYNLLDHLLAAHTLVSDNHSQSASSSSLKFCEQTLMDVALFVLFAGTDSIGNTMAYALHLITKDKAVLRNVREEIDGVEHEAPLDPEQLPYVRACFDEAVRLYPPSGVGNFRNLQKPLVLPKHNENDDLVTLPRGTIVLLPLWSIHRNASNFERPNEFLPERWVRRDTQTNAWIRRKSDDDHTYHHYLSSVSRAQRANFFGFSTGMRICPGGKYAVQEGVLVLASLLSHFDFELSDPNFCVIPERHGPVQRPQNGIPMKIRIRKS